MQRFLDLLISINCSSSFRRFLRPSSGAQNCTYSVRYCQTNTAPRCYGEWDGTWVPSHPRQKWLERCWSWSGRPRPTTLQPLLSNGNTRGSWYSCMLLMLVGAAPETC